jgi:Tol biopolymer transport system component
MARIAPRLLKPKSGSFALSRSPDGKRILLYLCATPIAPRPCSDASSGLFISNLDGSNLIQLSPPSVSVDLDQLGQGTLPAFSPDGKFVAFSGGKFGHGSSAVFVARTDGSGVRRVAGQGLYPTWSPDGRWIVYAGDIPVLAGGAPYNGWPRAIFVVHPDGTARRVVVRDPVLASSPVFSPTGAWIGYICNVGGGVCRAQPDGRNVRMLFRGGTALDGADVVTLAWSPDGRWLALQPQLWNVNVRTQPGITVIASSSGTPRILTRNPRRENGLNDMDAFEAWSPDSQSILYVHLCTSSTTGGCGRSLYRIAVSGSSRPKRVSSDWIGHDVHWHDHEITYLRGWD